MTIQYFPKTKEHILSLDSRYQSKIIKVVDLFEERGFEVTELHLKKLTQKIWELRAGQCRLLFSIVNGCAIVLEVFVKKTQKTPAKHIKLAVNRLKLYEKKDYINLT